MPVYHFFLKPSWNAPLIDRDGEEFTDDTAAYTHAVEVAREIMRNRETKCRSYRIEVRNENLEICSEILFASIDETLEHLPVDCRDLIIANARATASLKETIGEVRRTLSNVRETLINARDSSYPRKANND